MMENLNNEDRYKIKFQRNNNDQQMNSWEIGDFIFKISNNYYKKDLIRLISEELNKGVNPKNIFILDNGFDNRGKNSYSYVNTFDLTKNNECTNFYHLGNPISLIPNFKIYKILCLFSFFRKVYKKIHKNLNKTITKTNIKNYYIMLKEKDFPSVLSNLKDDIINDVLNKLGNIEKDVYKKKMFFDSKTIIEQKYNEILKKYHNYYEVSETINIIADKIINNSKVDFTQESHIKYQSYFISFFSELSKRKKPIVGVYNDENDTVRIIGYKYINKKEHNENELDIKEISHNSPLKALFIGGVCLALLIYSVKKKKVIQTSILNIDKEIVEVDAEIQQDKEEIDNLIKELAIKNQNMPINFISNNFIKEQLEKVNCKLEQSTKKVLDDYEFEECLITK